jgi:hypothetical protein
LGDIPLHSQVCETADSGQPIILLNGPQAQVYKSIAEKIAETLKQT